ncbi:MAG: ribosomal protein S18-alanine N-acetyltransferase [Clostridia bacterium]|nr:ribosomal protein S18-alanine N-acetyltransferase [Clostridia bacterium]
MFNSASPDVTRATPEDAAAIAALETLTFSAPYTEKSVRDMLSSTIHPSFVVRDGGELLGYLLGQMIVPEGELLRIAVRPSARRRGVGRALIEAFLAHLQENGCTVCFLDVREHNAPAQALYSSYGFTPLDRRKGYYHLPTEDAIIMQLPLNQKQ